MKSSPKSILLIKVFSGSDDRANAQDIQKALSAAHATDALFFSAAEEWVQLATEAVQKRIHQFSHLLFLGADQIIDSNTIAAGLEKLDADDMIAGFQYAFDATIKPYLIPFLLNHAFCVKRKMVVDFGIDFSGTFGELASSCQANRCGFRFMGFRQPENYFLKPEEIPVRDPEAKKIFQNYLGSQDRAWARFSGQFNLNKLRVLFDLRHFAPTYNGTNTCGVNIMRTLYQENPDLDVTLLCSSHVYKFLNFGELFPNWKTVELLQETTVYELHFVLGHPWVVEDLEKLNRDSYAVYYLILDSIAWDCLYIRSGFADLDRLWKYWSRSANGFLFISEFSKKIFTSRFPSSLQAHQQVCLLSTSSSDYHYAKDQTEFEQNGYYLIFGNHYSHKFIQPTIDLIKSHLTGSEKILVVDKTDNGSDERVIHYNSGDLSHAQMGALYRNAKAVFYPSQYEGFGLPVAEALSFGKTVFARKSSVLLELIGNWAGPGEVLPFDDNLDLIEKFKLFREGKSESFALRGHEQVAPNNWDAVGKKVYQFLMTTLQSSSTFEKTENRFRDYDFSKNLVVK